MFELPIVLARLKDACGAATRRSRPFAACGRFGSLTRAPLDGAGGHIRFAHRARGTEVTMLRIHDVMLDAITMMRPMVRAIERHDRDLASQLRRAASSVVLNLAEGSGSSGGVRTQRYRTALGSGRETMSCLLVAERFGYIDAVPAALVGTMNHVIGTLVRVTV
jgi:four helix bundle protein